MPEYTQDWFSGSVGAWRPHVDHLAGTPCKLLEIGSYEGRSACWMLQNLCADAGSRLVCVDPFADPDRDRRFDANTAETGRADRLVKLKGYSGLVVPTLKVGPFDLVYVDGGHEGWNVMEDAVLVWRRTKVGGVVIFDDYHLAPRRDLGVPPKEAIDAFLKLWAVKLDVLHRGYQVIVRKRA